MQRGGAPAPADSAQAHVRHADVKQPQAAGRSQNALHVQKALMEYPARPRGLIFDSMPWRRQPPTAPNCWRSGSPWARRWAGTPLRGTQKDGACCAAGPAGRVPTTTPRTLPALEHLRTLRTAQPGALQDPVAVELALWYHDAIYWPWSTHNEARSRLGRALSARPVLARNPGGASAPAHPTHATSPAR
jgi:hypothetical protein